MSTLDNQVALVTGGSRGIGREVAKQLASAGASVIVTGRNEAKLQETVSLITQQGGDCTSFVMDVTDEASVQQCVDTILEKYNKIDLLVNNAGIADGGYLPWDVSVNDWWQVLEVNVKGVFIVTKAVITHMVRQQSGRIINMGSYAGIYPNPDATAYTVSKAALMRLTDSMAEAAKDFGVSMFVISPGLVLTDMTRGVPAFEDVPADQWTPIEKSGELCVQLASGIADKLTGRFIHASDHNLDDLIAQADEIIAEEKLILHLKR